MDDREKLARLVKEVLVHLPWGEVSSHTHMEIADHLIANGVTVQKWIPVSEQLPTTEKPVLTYYGFNRGDGSLGRMYIGSLSYFRFEPVPHWQHQSNGLIVTHWMPLPKPPEK